MKAILFIFSVLFVQFCFAQKVKQKDILFSDDSSEVYFDLNLKNQFQNSFSKDFSLPVFENKIEFQKLVDSITIDKSTPEIDFENYEVHVQQICRYCQSHCNHEEGDNRICHRNACDYVYLFYKKKKNK